MVLALNAGVFDHGAGVSLQSRHGASDVSVDFYDLLHGGGFEEGGCDAFFDTKDYASAGCDLG